MSEKQALSTEKADAASKSARVLRPPVDIFEDAEGITVQLDMPGVSKERVRLQSERDTLTIEGDVEIPMPDGMEALYAEIDSTRYVRSFTLSGELDPDKAEAALKDGVLTVRIPKRPELRPRRIEVRAV